MFGYSVRLDYLNLKEFIFSYDHWLGYSLKKGKLDQKNWKKKREVPPGFEPRSPDSKSGVLTTTLWNRFCPRGLKLTISTKLDLPKRIPGLGYTYSRTVQTNMDSWTCVVTSPHPGSEERVTKLRWRSLLVSAAFFRARARGTGLQHTLRATISKFIRSNETAVLKNVRCGGCKVFSKHSPHPSPSKCTIYYILLTPSKRFLPL